MTDATEKVLTISVVIPVHNQRSYIEDAIRSVLTQDWAVQEVIVVDDGSTDAAYSELETLYQRVHVIRTENRGVSRARNLGAATVDSSVIAFLDADDVWLPGILQRLMTYLEQNSLVAAVFCKTRLWMPTRAGDGCETWHIPEELQSQETDAYRIRRLGYIDFVCQKHGGSIGGFFIRKAAFMALGGFDERRRYGEDHEFFIRASRSYRIEMLEYPGVLYRRHAESATKKLQEANHLADVIVDSVERYSLDSGDSAAADRSAIERRLGSVHFAHGYEHFWSGSHAIAKREFWRSCKYRLEIRALAYLVAAVTPGGRSLAGFLRKMIRR